MINVQCLPDNLKVYTFAPGVWLDIEEGEPDELSIKVKHVSNRFNFSNVIKKQIVNSGKKKGALKITVQE